VTAEAKEKKRIDFSLYTIVNNDMLFWTIHINIRIDIKGKILYNAIPGGTYSTVDLQRKKHHHDDHDHHSFILIILTSFVIFKVTMRASPIPCALVYPSRPSPTPIRLNPHNSSPFFSLPTEYDALVVVHDDPIFDVSLDGGNQNVLFQCPSLPEQVVHFIAVRNARNVLFDDRALVQICRGVVRRRADQFDAPLVRAMVRPATHESRQEGMVDVDDAIVEAAAKVVRYDLHVPGKHDQIDAVLGGLHELNFFLFLLGFGVFGNFEHLEGDAKRIRDGFQIGMVRNDEGDFAIEFSRTVPQQQFPQAVIVLGYHDTHPLLPIVPVQLVLHVESLAYLRHALFQALLVGDHF